MDAKNAHQTHLIPELKQRPTALAAERFAQAAQGDDALTRDQLLQALHELRVHQIEIEMQNEELRRIQLQRDDQLAIYFDLYDLAPVGYLSLSEQGLIVSANLNVANLLGIDRSSLLKQPLNRFILKEDQDIYYHHRRLVMESMTIQSCELRMVTPGAGFSWVHMESKIVEGNGAISFRVVLTNIADRVRLNMDLQEKNKALNEALQAADKANLAKSEFLARMSHELRLPLNAILGFSQLLASATSPAPTHEQNNRIDHILKAGWYLLGLINEILDLSVIESGNITLESQAICLADVVSDCAGMAQPAAEKNDVHLRVAEIDRRALVQADRVRLTQLVMNLLSNAVKYNRPGGTVHVSCAVVGTGRLRMEVRDSGEGMSADKLTKLFQPFNRLGQERGEIEGTGIGLVVSKRLVEMMGGAIGVESFVGVGSVFWIELPLAAPQVAAAVQRPALAQTTAAQGAGQLRSVMYVEDNPSHMELIRQLLAERPDLHFLAARDGAQGLAMARTYQPDVILLDLNLPDMSGVDALQRLRADPVTCQIPALAVSADAMAEDIHAALAAGFLQYLAKPIRIDELMQALNLALEVAQVETGHRRLIERRAAGASTPRDSDFIERRSAGAPTPS